MRRLLVAAALVLMTGVSAQAANLQNIDLGKNAQVWFAEDHTVPMVSFTISLPAGSAYDPAGKSGTASFAAAMLDEGAGKMSAKAYHEALAGRAIVFNARAERDYLVISISTLTENVNEAMRLLQLALSQPRFDADAMARVRTQILQSLQQEQADPRRVANRAFMKAFFGTHPYAHPTIGDTASINAITQQDLRAFARRQWVTHGLKVAVAGDIAPQTLQKLLGKTFLPISNAAPPPLAAIGRLGSPGEQVVPLPVPQPTIYFGAPGIMRHDPDFIPGYVANYILGGGGFSSRLTEEIRVKRGLTYNISSQITAYGKASVMVGTVATRANAVRQTLQIVRDTMAGFAKDGPTQRELDDAKTYLTGSFPLAFASNSGTAAQLGTFQRQNLDIGYVARRNALIQAVTIADVRRVAKRLYDPAKLTVVIGGTPAAANAPQRPRPPVRPAPQQGPQAAPRTVPAKPLTAKSLAAQPPMGGPAIGPRPAEKP